LSVSHRKQAVQVPQAGIVKELGLRRAFAIVFKEHCNWTLGGSSDCMSHLHAGMEKSLPICLSRGGDRHDQIPTRVREESRERLPEEVSTEPCKPDARAILHAANEVAREPLIGPQVPDGIG